MGAQVISFAEARGRRFGTQRPTSRPSGDAQKGDGAALARQRADLERACAEHALTIDQRQLLALRHQLDRLDPRSPRIGAIQSRIEQLQHRVSWCRRRLVRLSE